MEHLSNIFDPRLEKNKETFTGFSYNEWCAGPASIERAWNRHLEWVNSNEIGRPKATEKYTVEQLEEMGMVGIYRKNG